jgi:hypothetical protein
LGTVTVVDPTPTVVNVMFVNGAWVPLNDAKYVPFWIVIGITPPACSIALATCDVPVVRVTMTPGGSGLRPLASTNARVELDALPPPCGRKIGISGILNGS